MAKNTRANRAAIQSVRAKARKALAVDGVKLPNAVVNHLDAVISWADGKLAAKVTKLVTAPAESVSFEDAIADADGGAMATDEAENSGADLEAVAWAARLQELTAA